MRRVLVLLVALAFLPALCRAQINITNYQVSITGNWTETNPSCISNCTATASISYEFEENNDAFNSASPNVGIYGWIVNSTIQTQSTGFLGTFTNVPTSGLSIDWD